MIGSGTAVGSSTAMRWSRWSAQLANQTQPPDAVQAPPPYSWTRVRALNPSGSTSVVAPSGVRRTTWTRPPSAGRSSLQ